jgi:hypothetical protein
MGSKSSVPISQTPWAEEVQVHECSDTKCDCDNWRQVRLAICHGKLEIYEADAQLLEVTLGHDIAVMAEQPSSSEFILTLDSDGKEKFWRVRVSSTHLYISCVTTLKFSCRPPWTPNSLGRCEACEARFSMLLKRHHCRYCGSLVCSRCSEHKSLIPTLGYNSPQRVCKICWKLLECYKRRVMRASKASKSMWNAATYLHTIEAERFTRAKEKKGMPRSSICC